MRKFFRRKIVMIPLVILLTLAVVATGGGFWMVQHSLATTSGEVLGSTEKPVKIVRDDYGVPHIYAETEHDLFYAQGYVHAQDRLWQMELSRRLVEGRLSEVFGATSLPEDRFHNTIDFKRAAEESIKTMDADTLKVLQAYADGVNQFLKEEPLPVEFTIAGFEPESWTIVDSVCISKYMAWYLGGNTSVELFMNAVSKKLGLDKAYSLIPEYGRTDGKTDQPLADVSEATTSEFLEQLYASRNYTSPGDGVGSNNWVIGGSKSESGKPMLANDMHLSFSTPSNFYQNHLYATGLYNVTGAIFPGVPGVIVGHNDHVSWGFTNLGPDVQDLYIEKQNPSNPHQFEYNGQWYDAEVRNYEIKVKGQAEPEKLETITTRHGPIINNIQSQAGSSQKEEQLLAFHWTALEPSQEITAALKMSRASNWTEFEKGLRYFLAPAQNVVYADTDGNIAYRANGHIPIRKKGNGLLPVPGWTDEYEWDGYIPWDELPTVMNPKEGYIATANNKIIDDSYKYHITYEWADPYRINRIKEMIGEKDKLNLQDLQKMQNDFYNGQAALYKDIWLPILEKQTWNDEEKQALQTLKEWMKNPIDDKDLVGPSIYHAVMNKTMEAVFEPQIGEGLYTDLLITGLSTNALDSVMTGENQKWFAGTDNSLEKSLVQGFKDGIKLLDEKLGKKQADWKWGAIHQITFTHTLGNIPALGLFFNDGPYPYGGSHVTVGAASYSKKKQPYKTVIVAPWRFTVDMANPAGGQDIMIMGNSGQIGSAHYKDQTPKWLKGEYKGMYYDQADVEKHGEKTLILKPKK